jgi:hypothetical protein
LDDTGQKLYNVDGTISLIGAHNGELDTEDLNSAGRFDISEEVADSYFISRGEFIKTNASGCQQIRIPLNITGDNSANWKNIKILRLRC